MKKSFLLTLAVLGLLITSCKEEPYYEGNPNKENYMHVFINQFGLIDVDNDWGFSPARQRASAPASRAASRANAHTDVNGNQWKNPPLIKEWERRAVMEFLHKNGTIGNVGDLGNAVGNAFFVTQVGNCSHTFDESYVFNPQKNGVNGRIHGTYDPEETIEGHDLIHSYGQMDNLHVAYTTPYSMDNLNSSGEGDVWAHINNFNASSNANFNGNTVVLGDGAYHLAYYNSLTSKYQDEYIVIPGWLVDYRLSSYYYVCFDFESIRPEVVTRINVTFATADNPNDSENGIDVPGIYDDVKDIPNDAVIAAIKSKNGKIATSIKTKTYVGVTQAKMYVKSDGIYDDWVIRICGNAIRKDDTKMPSYPYEDYEAFRIFVEDLSVSAGNSLSSNASDWDFNDLVFDAKIKQIEGHEDVTVTIRALGGTLPIYIEDAHGNRTNELHWYFDKLPSSVMINTGTGTTKPAVTLNLSDLGLDFGIDFSNMETFSVTQGESTLNVTRVPAIEYKKLKVVVNVGGTDREMNLMEMDAEPGQAPSKLCVPSYLAHPMERVLITDTYPKFPGYVQGTYSNFWETALDTTDFWGKEKTNN